jgi:hypothetical protein
MRPIDFISQGPKITAIEAKAGSIYLPEKYDILYTDAVVEHLPSHSGRSHQGNRASSEPGRYHDFIVNLSAPTTAHPYHPVVDIREIYDHLSTSGLSCKDGFQTLYSIWRRQLSSNTMATC